MKNLSNYTKSLFNKKLKINENLTITTEYEGKTQEEEIQDDYLAPIANSAVDAEDFVKKLVYGITDTTSELPNPEDKDKIIDWFNKHKGVNEINKNANIGKKYIDEDNYLTIPAIKFILTRDDNEKLNNYFKIHDGTDYEYFDFTNKSIETAIAETAPSGFEFEHALHILDILFPDTYYSDYNEYETKANEGKQMFVLKDEMKRAIEGEGTPDEKARKCAIVAVDYAKKMASTNEGVNNEETFPVSANRIYNVLSGRTFEEFYKGDFMDYIEGTEDAKTRAEILEAIFYMFK